MKTRRYHKMHQERKVALLNYFETPEAATDAAVELDIPLQSVWKYIRELKKSGHIEAIEGLPSFPMGLYTTYKWTGRPLDLEEKRSEKDKYNRGFTFMGVRF